MLSWLFAQVSANFAISQYLIDKETRNLQAAALFLDKPASDIASQNIAKIKSLEELIPVAFQVANSETPKKLTWSQKLRFYALLCSPVTLFIAIGSLALFAALFFLRIFTCCLLPGKPGRAFFKIALAFACLNLAQEYLK